MKLNSQQQAAVEFAGGHVLVLAGAGTGKTRVIINRAAHLIQSGCEPSRILMLTFTRRAAQEVTERLSQMVGDAAAGIQAGTFHHYCLMTMRRMPKLFDLAGATVIDRDDQVQLFKLARGKDQDKIQDGQFPQAAKLADLYSYARNTNQTPQAYLEKFTDYDSATIEKILQIFAGYTARKKQNNYLDYDDILFRFAQRLHAVPEVGEHLRGLYDHILTDEMQDTNPLQWLILDGLRDPAKLFCVGDDAQSIYAFRGADFKNVHSFAERVPDATILKLEENYRSTQENLDLANWLLDQSPLAYDKRLRAARGKGVKPRLLDFDGDFGEGRWIAGDLIEQHEGGAAWKDHMVITRTGYAARSLEAILVEKKIPYHFIGGTSLLQAAHVKDLFCLIRSAASQRDELAWVRYLTLWPHIGDRTATRLIEGIRDQSDVDAALGCLRRGLGADHDLLAGLSAVLKQGATRPPRSAPPPTL